ncbi:MAG: hypothetical protein EOO01_15510, partial [Chitinophagaceae bacterium]
MRLKTKLTLLTYLITGSLVTRAQNDFDETDKFRLDNVSIPSPSVTGMAKFVDAPVNLSIGSPNISIPLYTINTGKLSWPITLSYNPSGIRVNENSGNVGLAWTIECEGSIVENILGRRDDGSYQANGLSWTNAALIPNTADNFTLLTSLANGSIDGAPDMYMYNFGGQSGKFIMADQLRLLPNKNILVAAYIDPSGQKCWKITDESGILYYFTAMETTKTKSSYANPLYFSWMLTKVVDANHVDSLIFEYEDTYTESPVGKSYEINNWDTAGSIDNWGVDMSPSDPPIPGTLTQWIQQSHGKQLKKIIFANGSVEYDITWNDRDDMFNGFSSTFNIPRVRNLFVKDKAGTVIKTIHFDQDYFLSPGVNDENGKRLKLNAVVFTDLPTHLSGPNTQKYSFEYSSRNLPSKLSNGIDHWGYYNGKNNNPTLIPSMTVEGMHYYGADRTTSPYYFDAGMLEKVTYPTGGSTKYFWDPHVLVIPAAGQYLGSFDSVLTEAIYPEGTGWTEHSLTSASFQLPNNDTFDLIDATLRVVGGFPANTDYESKNHAAPTVFLYEINNGNTIVKKSLSVKANTPGTLNFVVKLRKGRTYYIVVKVKGGYGYSVQGKLTVEWPKLMAYPGSTEYIGGCRVSRIETYDPMNGKTLVKKYTYSNPSVLKRP